MIRKLWVKNPLLLVLMIGLILRLIAAFFAKGYLMHDDHFLVIEAASSWAHGTDYNHWLPWTPGNNGPEGHSFFYVGIHFLLFKLFLNLGLEDPHIQMLVIRLIHAFYSLLIIYYGFKLTLRYGNKNQARMVGLILAMLFVFPNFSVRNLVEMVCIPPLMGGLLQIGRYEESGLKRHVVFAGLVMGLAVGIRYQAGLIPLGVGLVFLIFNRNFKDFLIFGLSSAFAFFLTQLPDLFIWEKPFAELTEYIRYNFLFGSTYFKSAPYMYLLTIGGALIPPLSLFFLFGAIREWRRLKFLVMPSFLFLLVHSLIQNKQERFILPIIPLIIIAGMIGWYNYTHKSTFWQKRKALNNVLWGWFWLINSLVLCVATVSYGKRSRVEAMYWLYEQGSPNFVVEYSFRDEIRYPPQFYSGYWGRYSRVDKSTDLDLFVDNLENADNRPQFVLFYEEPQRSERIEAFNQQVPIEFREFIEPSFLDETLHSLNPKNRIERVHIYEILWSEKND